MIRNSGIITESHTELDIDVYEHFRRGKTALVTQGGGQRGIFTAGVLDAFLLSNFDPFDEFYGTSAGALNLCAYLCRQHGMGKAFITDLTTSTEFFNLFRYIRRQQYLGLEWALERIQGFPYKLDLDLGRAALGGRGAFAAVTNVDTLSDQYMPILGDAWFNTMLATCAVPKLYHGPVDVGGTKFVDGGVAASIPVQEAWRQNARNIIVIRTEPFSEIEARAQSEVGDVPVEWYRESINSVQQSWQQKVNQWKSDWAFFFQQKINATHQSKLSGKMLLNGGRWLFGADNLYRLSHLVGENFDSGLADMLMIHYQTFELTQAFLSTPPDDTFILQIAPREELRASSLLSDPESLEHDYQLGLQAGFNLVQLYEQLNININDRESA
ncbi:putative patatin/cPLA2 family phospholipase [Vibrio sp. ES.051]|uniref:patatin-like phospholipase family protein n=1 Tax=Vibrio sp. ES.051 TaxID=1761909 RepID=UPI000BF2D92C|nr:patatin-like phospholipase family protein [Vibrio sp. ES.051]PFG55828.1 putative patatin/cPLA2 family phospholipase [Vibrio sp. ES.051]